MDYTRVEQCASGPTTTYGLDSAPMRRRGGIGAGFSVSGAETYGRSILATSQPTLGNL